MNPGEEVHRLRAPLVHDVPPQPAQHERHRPRGPRQVHAHRLALGRGRDHRGGQGRGDQANGQQVRWLR